jgi:hypothetical protein
MKEIALLQTTGGTTAFLINLLPIAAVVLVLYFFVIARAKKERQKTTERQMGDRVAAERIWSNKSDEECDEAAKHLKEYTEEAERAIRIELRRRSMTEPPRAISHEETPESSEGSVSRPTSERLSRRYHDAYIVARTVIAVGKGINAIGVIIALAVVAVAYMAAESFGVPARATFGAAGVLAGTIIYVFGVLIASQGQLQFAILDVAVNSSPLLSAECKRDVVLGLE